MTQTGAGSSAAIVFAGVHASRGPIAVLRGFDLAIGAGETIALVGRSGAGKSTILKLINGLLQPDEGDVLVMGQSTRVWNGSPTSRSRRMSR